MNIPDSDQVMTIHEVASFLKFSDSKVYRLVQRGELPSRKIGGQWRVWRPALEAYLEQKTGAPAGEGAREEKANAPQAQPDLAVQTAQLQEDIRAARWS